MDFDIDFVGPIVRAPEGGFLVTSNQGIPFTSAFGNSWKRNPRSDIGCYQSDDQRLLMQDRAEMSRVIDPDREERFRLPAGWTDCQLAPAATVIAAVCSNSSSPVMTVAWKGMELSRV